MSTFYSAATLNPTFPGTVGGSGCHGKSCLRIVSTGDTREHWENLPSLVSGFQALTQTASPVQDTLKLSTGNHNIGKGPLGGELSTLVNNLLGLDVMAFGNLEADLQPQTLADTLQKANYKVLCNNAVFTKTTVTANPFELDAVKPPIQLAPAIVEGKNGRYGVIALTIPGLEKQISPDHPGHALSVQNFNTTRAMATHQIAQLTAQGIKKVVVVSNLMPQQNAMLGATVAGIDVIIGAGHGAAPNQNLFRNARTHEPVLLINGGQNAETIGTTNLVFDKNGVIEQFNHRTIETKRFPKNETAQTVINQHLMPPMVLGQFASGAENPNDQLTENPLANYLADRVRQTTGADVALVRASEIRDRLDAGTLNHWRLFSMLPFAEPYVVKPVSGADLMAAVQQFGQALVQKAKLPSSAGYHPPSMLHPSGLQYAIDHQGNAQVRIWSNTAQQWLPVNPNQTYSVAMSSYTAGNTHQYPALAKNAPQQPVGFDLSALLRDTLYAQAQTGITTPVQLPTDGRVQIDTTLQALVQSK